MSFILDALKKSESDRQRQASPALFEVKVAAPRRGFPVWAVGLGALLVVNIVVLAWVLVRRADAPAAPLAAGAAPTAAVESTPVASASGAQPGTVRVPATVVFPTQVEIPVGSAPTVSVAQAPAQPQSQPGVVGPSTTPPLTEEPYLQEQQPAVPPDYDARDYRPAITPAQAGAIAAARRNGTLPSRDEMIAQGNEIPNLRLDLHVYAQNAADRFVFINMRKLREGESLPEGIRVEQITPTGAELSWRGQRFTLDGN
ncbi:MAG TPA: general secretion pathway protein GspB [Steroidobacteraceae bacterium]|nr:general secretion pathway protein GspB [Steroidobacteraceae bacterium]